MTWGDQGSGPGEFNIPHALAFDSKGRLFVADRGNNRIQIFDSTGKISSPSGSNSAGRAGSSSISMTRSMWPTPSQVRSRRTMPHGNAASELEASKMDRWRHSFRIPSEMATGTSAAEGVAVDANGVIYGAEVGPKDLKKYVKK